MKTHIVLDLTYTIEEGQETFAGTETECYSFLEQQGANAFTYKIVPMSPDEYRTHNEPMKPKDQNARLLQLKEDLERIKSEINDIVNEESDFEKASFISRAVDNIEDAQRFLK